MKREQKLNEFAGYGYDKGRPKLVQAAWVVINCSFVERIWCPPSLRVLILRAFGARIGKNVLVRHGVRIHWPWKLEVGDNVWLGVDAWLLNLERITIGSNVCISQAAFLCTGSHDFRSRSFEFDNAPIVVEDEAWIAMRATILRGVRVGARSIVGATALVTQDVPPDTLVYATRALLKRAGD